MIQFSTRSREEVSKALLDMQNLGMKNLIFDLRDNSGGLLSSAIEVASFFLPKEQLVVELEKVVNWMNFVVIAQSQSLPDQTSNGCVD